MSATIRLPSPSMVLSPVLVANCGINAKQSLKDMSRTGIGLREQSVRIRTQYWGIYTC